MIRIFNVTEINKYIKEMFLREPALYNVYVKGEISNFKLHYSGHAYFTLKDEACTIKCVMFKTNCQFLRFSPENGMKVIIRGSISVFERDGQYQLYAEEMQPDGIGALHKAFEQLKLKLQNEGLFDEERKKHLPFMPSKIAVITSLTGAVIKDIISVSGRRFHNIEIKIIPVLVQGEQAAPQIARAIELVNRLRCADVIIIARGGGSLEELWAFNEEIVARSIISSDIPVVSAVGHETDYTIADFVADLRAPTPSAAAELVIPEKRVLIEKIRTYRYVINNLLLNRISREKVRLDEIKRSTAFRQPFERIYQERMKLDIILRDMARYMDSKMYSVKEKVAGLYGKLDALSPVAILARGYSIAFNTGSSRYIKSINEVRPDDIINVRVSDGKIKCAVVDTEGLKNAKEQA